MVKVLSVNGKIPLVDGKAIKAQDGGSSTVELDTTLSEAGKAADAKAVGDALAGKQDTISDLEAIRSGAAKGATALQSVPSTYRTASEQDTIDSGKVDKVTGKGLSSNDYTDAAKAKVDALAPVATSGNYNDLTNKPTIPTVLPNPHKLTINGTEYDGSTDVQMTIEGSGGSAGNVQSDWNQNDSTAADYVKNRPFYSQHEEGYLIENKSVSIESATKPVYVRGDVAYLPFSVGETYKVTWDGVEYSCTANSIRGQVYIGNANLAGASDGNNEPFVIMYSNGDYVLVGAVGEHNFSISGGIERITKLPSKFLPPAEDYIPSSYAKTMEIFFGAPIEQLIEAEEHFMANGVLYLANKLVLGITGSLSAGDQVTFYTQEAKFTFKSDGTDRTSYTLENNVRHNSDGSPNGIILNSKDSSKQFLITVDDNGTISATEV